MTFLQLDSRLVKQLQTLTFAAVAALVVAGLLGHIAHFAFDLTAVRPWRLIYFLFDLNEENNIPTWFSSMLLALCGLILLAIGASSDPAVRPWRRQWYLLGTAFLFLSLDEFASLHERLIRPLQETFGFSGLLTNAWVLVALPLVAILGLVLIPFLRNLPAHTRNLFMLSGAIYVGGAAGVELISGLMKSQYGMDDIRFAFSTFVEETLELGGLALFMKAASDRLMIVYGAR